MFCAYQLTLCYQQCQRLCLFTHSWDGHRNKVVISNAVGVIPKSLGHVGAYLNTKQNFVFQTVALNLGEVAAVVRAPEPFENKLCTSTSPPQILQSLFPKSNISSYNYSTVISFGHFYIKVMDFFLVFCPYISLAT